jgi:hypothetical protein
MVWLLVSYRYPGYAYSVAWNATNLHLAYCLADIVLLPSFPLLEEMFEAAIL